MDKHDYSIFTKQELVDFLTKNEGDFRFIGSPFEMLLDEKIDETHKQIHKHSQNTRLITTRLEFAVHHDKWKKLDSLYEKLSKLRFGE